MPTGTPLEPTIPELRALLDEAVDHLLVHLSTLPEQPAAFLGDPRPAVEAVREPLPERGIEAGGLLAWLFRDLIPVSYNTAAAGYLAYIPGGGLPASAVAELIASMVNRYVGVWAAAPALAELEATVVRWFAEMVGFPSSARGYLSSGGSLANFTAIVTARRARLPENFFAGRIYASDQIHHSVLKAASLAGFPPGNVRRIASDGSFRLRRDELEAAIAADRAAGHHPFLLVASAGTTNTGAVDDLEGLAELARREGLWLHVDAAYGGFFALTARGRAVLAGLERADSITLDPHKGLFLPYGTGCLLVREGEHLYRAHAADADYMPNLAVDREQIDFCQISPELSRNFRGLSAWLPLKLAGAAAFRAALDEKLELAAWAAEELRKIPDIELVAPPELSLLAFRLRPVALPAGEWNALNRRLLERINARQRVHLSGTEVRGAFVLRICVLSFRTHRQHLAAALADLTAAIAEVST